ncbi:MarR family winged helix-turn-helix transcriptional regulator [Clostridium fallax]|uniref:DNA-binding transcriptional regulator, MarR family n=1 Tax=Clostridium fallax TaxID=1533 RepID=A0A1M4T8V2_9CLOT|nr:MarR family transcriptional regulator [Clostridium fallax]SHE40933.1 DNA-binding transcriptional regulator, MarR family [Clostridium fallax]SQB22655.1 transcriptional regulator TrmB [Clostridium fallax]
MRVDYNLFGKYISEIYRFSNSFLTKKYAKFNIGSGQIMFMINIYKNEGISQEKLSEMLNIDKGTTARAIKKLEDQGYVIRLKDRKDRRAYNIMPTYKALQIKKEFFNILNEWNKKITENLTEEEVSITLSALEKISENQKNKGEDLIKWIDKQD